MESIKLLGYIYKKEEEAKKARKQCADFYNLPAEDNDITEFFVNYNYSENDNFYYILWCEGCTEILGKPIVFEITEPIIQ